MTGLVPEPTGQVAQDGEMLGTIDHHGGVRPLRRHGPPFTTSTRDNRQIGQGKRMRRTLATRYDSTLLPLKVYSL